MDISKTVDQLTDAISEAHLAGFPNRVDALHKILMRIQAPYTDLGVACLLQAPIANGDLGLTQRSQNVLCSPDSGIRTVIDLLTSSEQVLLEIDNFGDKSFRDVRSTLTERVVFSHRVLEPLGNVWPSEGPIELQPLVWAEVFEHLISAFHLSFASGQDDRCEVLLSVAGHVRDHNNSSFVELLSMPFTSQALQDSPLRLSKDVIEYFDAHRQMTHIVDLFVYAPGSWESIAQCVHTNLVQEFGKQLKLVDLMPDLDIFWPVVE